LLCSAKIHPTLAFFHWIDLREVFSHACKEDHGPPWERLELPQLLRVVDGMEDFGLFSGWQESASDEDIYFGRVQAVTSTARSYFKGLLADKQSE
jgi:hypothetical protein